MPEASRLISTVVHPRGSYNQGTVPLPTPPLFKAVSLAPAIPLPRLFAAALLGPTHASPCPI